MTGVFCRSVCLQQDDDDEFLLATLFLLGRSVSNLAHIFITAPYNTLIPSSFEATSWQSRELKFDKKDDQTKLNSFAPTQQTWIL